MNNRSPQKRIYDSALFLVAFVLFIQIVFIIRAQGLRAQLDGVTEQLTGIELFSPAPGEEVSGNYMLRAKTFGNASSVTFRVTPIEQSTGTVTRGASLDTSLGEWFHDWDTSQVANGQYFLQAEAFNFNGLLLLSTQIEVNVNNILPFALSTDVASLNDPYSLAIVSPAQGHTIDICSVSDASLATAQKKDNTCQVTPLANGTVVITAVNAQGDTARIDLEISLPSFSVSPANLSFVALGAEKNIVIAPPYELESCSSSDTSIATVNKQDSACVVQSVGQGEGTISVNEKGGRSKEVPVIVSLSGIDGNNSTDSSEDSTITEIKSFTFSIDDGNDVISEISLEVVLRPHNSAVILRECKSSDESILQVKLKDNACIVSGLQNGQALVEGIDVSGLSGTAVLTVDIPTTQGAPRFVILNPQQNAQIESIVKFNVTINKEINVMEFVLDDPNTDDIDYTFTAQPSDTEGIVSEYYYVFDNEKVISGKYNFYVKARLADRVWESNRVSVHVSSNAVVSEPTSVSMILPSANDTVAGVSTLRAGTSKSVSGLNFILQNESGREFALFGQYDTITKTWNAEFDSTRYADGEYKLFAQTAGDALYTSNILKIYIENNSKDEEEDDEVEESDSEEEKVLTTKDVIKTVDSRSLQTVKNAEDLSTLLLRSQAVQDTDAALPKDCLESGITSLERCNSFMEYYKRNITCRSLGIVVREQCIQYLQSRGVSDVNETELVGFMSLSEVEAMQEQVLGLVNKQVSFEHGASDEIPETMQKYMPISKANITVWASPPIEQVADEPVVASPALVFLDADLDGLEDGMELRLGTDPHNPDTDGDGINDRDEVANNTNPNGEGEKLFDLRGIDKVVIDIVPIAQPLTSGEVNPEYQVQGVESSTEQGIRLSGKAAPNVTVTLYIYSYLPVMVTMNTDENGNWEYVFENELIDGAHEAYVAVNDDTGRVTEKSTGFPFFIAQAQAVEEADFFRADVNVQDQSQQYPRYFLWASLAIIVLAVIVVIRLVSRKEKSKYENFDSIQ